MKSNTMLCVRNNFHKTNTFTFFTVWTHQYKYESHGLDLLIYRALNDHFTHTPTHPPAREPTVTLSFHSNTKIEPNSDLQQFIKICLTDNHYMHTSVVDISEGCIYKLSEVSRLLCNVHQQWDGDILATIQVQQGFGQTCLTCG